MSPRWAVTAVFAANGALIASWAVRTPSLKLEHGLGDGWVGVISALFGIAALATMRLAGRVAARFGSALVLRSCLGLLPAALVLVGSVRSLPLLVVGVLVLGAVHGAVDVTMNAHAVAVERALERPVLSGCHAAWSIGAVAGASGGGAAAGAGLSLLAHWALVACVLVPVALVAGARLLPSAADRSVDAGSGGRRPGGAWTWRVVALGLMGAAVLTCEAAVANWSGVLLHEHRGASLGTAALGYTIFSASQTLGRLGGDRLVARRPGHQLVRRGAALGACGMALAVLAPSPVLSLAGFAVLGVGLAAPLPVLFGVVGRLGEPAEAAVLVSKFTTLTYAGILLAPPLIGWCAELLGLVPTLASLAAVLAVVSLTARSIVPWPGGAARARVRRHRPDVLSPP